MPIKFDNSIINQILQSTDIVDVVSEHLSLDRKGKEFVGLCPFHTDHKPSMYVNPVKQIFKCFACGAGGDVFKFIQLRENLTFPAAIERLAERAGISLPKINKPLRPNPAVGDQAQADPKIVAKVNEWVKNFWKENLFDKQKGATAREYLKQRQISEESVKNWDVGLASDSWDELLTSAGRAKVKPKFLLQAGLLVEKENDRFYDKFRNRLMFPIKDVTSRVIAFGGRTLGDDPAKYMNSPATVLFDKSNSLYGLDKARHSIVSSGTAIVVEGYTDVIMCHQFGCTNVLATLGTSFTDGHAKILRRFAKRIVLVFDNDVAGVEAANRALEVCLIQRIDIKVAFVTEGKDPCDFLLTAGKKAFDKMIENAIDVMDYKWQRLHDGLEQSDNYTDRRALIDQFLLSIATAMKSGMLDPIAQGLIVSKLSPIIGLSADQIYRELKRLHQRVSRTRSFAVKNQKVVSIDNAATVLQKARREVLEVLINDPSLYFLVSGRVGPSDFVEHPFDEIADILFHLLAGGQEFDISELLKEIETTDASNVLTTLSHAGSEKGDLKKRLEDAIEVIEGNLEQNHRRHTKAGIGDDETETLRKMDLMLKKGNKRNPGLMAN
ncbi:MAG: DNA primase [Planctomycetes bacterium]|nr:DNA primase [Planctomycetota bacterium]